MEILDGDFMAGLAEHALRVARRLEAIVMPHINAAAVTGDQAAPISEGIE